MVAEARGPHAPNLFFNLCRGSMQLPARALATALVLLHFQQLNRRKNYVSNISDYIKQASKATCFARAWALRRLLSAEWTHSLVVTHSHGFPIACESTFKL